MTAALEEIYKTAVSIRRTITTKTHKHLKATTTNAKHTCVIVVFVALDNR